MGLGLVLSPGLKQEEERPSSSAEPPICPSEHQRTPGPDAGPEDGRRLHGRGGEAADGNPAAGATAAAGTPEEGGQRPDRGPEVLLVTTETGGQHRVQRRLVLHQRRPLVEEERYALSGGCPSLWSLHGDGLHGDRNRGGCRHGDHWFRRSHQSRGPSGFGGPEIWLENHQFGDELIVLEALSDQGRAWNVLWFWRIFSSLSSAQKQLRPQIQRRLWRSSRMEVWEHLQAGNGDSDPIGCEVFVNTLGPHQNMHESSRCSGPSAQTFPEGRSSRGVRVCPAGLSTCNLLISVVLNSSRSDYKMSTERSAGSGRARVDWRF